MGVRYTSNESHVNLYDNKLKLNIIIFLLITIDHTLGVLINLK